MTGSRQRCALFNPASPSARSPSLAQRRQVSKCVRTGLAATEVEEEVIFVKDGSGAVLFLAFLLFFMTAIKQAPHHRATRTHTHTGPREVCSREKGGQRNQVKICQLGRQRKAAKPAGRPDGNTDDLWGLFLRMVK